jgi:cysteine desulfurase
MTSYFDCAATSPIDPDARAALLRFTDLEYGNAGSRTHEFGTEAKRAVQAARVQIAAQAGARADEVIFTSGATEANNLAILGLRPHGEATGKRHIVTTAIEHKAVLEPVQALVAAGFEATIIAPGGDGRVDAEAVLAAVRPDTMLVSVMHANNETGALQPITAIAAGLAGTAALFHVDAAQSFGKLPAPLTDPKIHMISVSGHKLYAPKGVGALIVRRGETKVPLAPLTYGGGQERGLRPGTLPVALVAAFGAACAAASRDADARAARCREIRRHLLDAVEPLGAMINGSSDHGLASTLNISFPGLDSEAVMLVLKDLVALSNGSACTSASYDPSHVLVAMDLPNTRIDGALRFSWCHMTDELDWAEVARRIEGLR